MPISPIHNWYGPNSVKSLNIPQILEPHANQENVSLDLSPSSSEKAVINPVHVGEFIYDDTDTNIIGEGAYGCVYAGFRRLRSFSVAGNKIYKKWEAQRVAIKKVPNSKVKPQEIEMMHLLRSEFLVSLLDIQHTSLYTFVVMELCAMDLQQHIDLKLSKTGNGALSELNLSKVLDNLARGYNVLYHHAIVHRDIKPSNIMLKYSTDHNGIMGTISSAKITDFGISRLINQDEDEDEGMSNVAGTMLYMAPEVGANLLNTCHYDSKVDMWSIGCVLYQCLTGETPFDEASLCRLFLKAAAGNTFPCSSRDGPHFPPQSPFSIRKLLLALLEIDSKKRISPPSFCRKALQCAKGGLYWNQSCADFKCLNINVNNVISTTDHSNNNRHKLSMSL